MSLAALLVASAVAVPPGEPVVDHSQPGHVTQPAQHYFRRRLVDDARGHAWMCYVDELDALWADYRAAGSTPEAWKKYLIRAAAAKRCYVYQDPYYAAQVYYVRHVRPEDYRECNCAAACRPPHPREEADDDLWVGLDVDSGDARLDDDFDDESTVPLIPLEPSRPTSDEAPPAPEPSI